MADKGNKTRVKIIQAAKALFIEKGYAAVSMSDLCLATGLSRGGLYRHFSSTEEVFSSLLTIDKENWEQEMEKAIQAETSAIRMIKFFFEQFKQDISENAGRLSLATYEFERSQQDKHGFLHKRYESAVNMMERLLCYGQERGEFSVFEPRLEAEHLTIYLDGLKMASAAISFSAEMVAQQLDYQLNRILKNGGEPQ